MKVKGTIQKIDLNGGVWVLQADDGQTYELYDCPEQIKNPGKSVVVHGKIIDVETMNMVGSVLQVTGFSTLSP